MKDYSFGKIVFKILVSVLIAAIIGAAGALYIIYNGPSETYREAFREYISQSDFAFINEWFGGEADE